MGQICIGHHPVGAAPTPKKSPCVNSQRTQAEWAELLWAPEVTSGEGAWDCTESQLLQKGLQPAAKLLVAKKQTGARTVT